MANKCLPFAVIRLLCVYYTKATRPDVSSDDGGPWLQLVGIDPLFVMRELLLQRIPNRVRYL